MSRVTALPARELRLPSSHFGEEAGEKALPEARIIASSKMRTAHGTIEWKLRRHVRLGDRLRLPSGPGSFRLDTGSPHQLLATPPGDGERCVAVGGNLENI